MAEVVRARILKPGIKVENRPTDVGQTVDFTRINKFTSVDGGHAVVEGKSNSVWAKAWQRENHLIVPSALTVAQDTTEPRTVTVERELAWGANPELGSKRDLGSPDPAMEVSFLGHRLREPMEEMMTTQTEDYNPTRTLRFSDEEEIIFGGQVLHSESISGVDDTTQEHHLRGGPKFTFPGDVMMGAYMYKGYRLQHPQLTLFTATRAEQDGLIRVEESRELYVSEFYPGTTEVVANALAEVSVFTRNMDQDPSLQDHFPALLTHHLSRTINDRPDVKQRPDVWDFTKKSLGIDWPEVVASLPKKDVRDEQGRIASILFAAGSEN